MSERQNNSEIHSEIVIKFDPNMDYYNILGVGANATTEEIQSTYRNLVKKLHPDTTGNTGTAATADNERFSKITEAYKVLKNVEVRFKYDNVREGWNTGSQVPCKHTSWADIDDMVSDFLDEAYKDLKTYTFIELHIGITDKERKEVVNNIWVKYRNTILQTDPISTNGIDRLNELSYIFRRDYVSLGSIIFAVNLVTKWNNNKTNKEILNTIASMANVAGQDNAFNVLSPTEIVLVKALAILAIN